MKQTMKQSFLDCLNLKNFFSFYASGLAKLDQKLNQWIDRNLNLAFFLSLGSILAIPILAIVFFALGIGWYHPATLAISLLLCLLVVFTLNTAAQLSAKKFSEDSTTSILIIALLAFVSPVVFGIVGFSVYENGSQLLTTFLDIYKPVTIVSLGIALVQTLFLTAIAIALTGAVRAIDKYSL